MVVAVPGMVIVQMAGHEVVDVTSVRRSFVSACRSMPMRMIMR